MIWTTPDLIALCFDVAILAGGVGYVAGVLIAGGEWARQIARGESAVQVNLDRERVNG